MCVDLLARSLSRNSSDLARIDPEDVDLGYVLTYTGCGGRDLKGSKDAPKNLRTAPQSSDQTFDNPLNRALQVSAETQKPVRIVRFPFRMRFSISLMQRSRSGASRIPHRSHRRRAIATMASTSSIAPGSMSASASKSTRCALVLPIAWSALM